MAHVGLDRSLLVPFSGSFFICHQRDRYFGQWRSSDFGQLFRCGRVSRDEGAKGLWEEPFCQNGQGQWRNHHVGWPHVLISIQCGLVLLCHGIRSWKWGEKPTYYAFILMTEMFMFQIFNSFHFSWYWADPSRIFKGFLGEVILTDVTKKEIYFEGIKNRVFRERWLSQAWIKFNDERDKWAMLIKFEGSFKKERDFSWVFLKTLGHSLILMFETCFVEFVECLNREGLLLKTRQTYVHEFYNFEISW